MWLAFSVTLPADVSTEKDSMPSPEVMEVLPVPATTTEALAAPVMLS